MPGRQAGAACSQCVTGHTRRYTLPKELSEFKVLCPAARKPALLAALLAELAPQGPTIVFTASVAMAHR